MNNIFVENLSVQYGKQTILKGINLQVNEGDFIAIVGKSGSGKTTLLHALAGFIKSTGKICISKKIGMLFQHYAVFPWLTVEENIAFGLEDETKDKKLEIVSKNIRLAQLEDKKEKYPAELSGGQVQRVVLARSLAHNPDILLMDEPYGALDAYTRDQMQRWLLDVWIKSKKTILFVTHNIEEAIFLSNKVMVLKDGEFIAEYNIPFTYPRNEEIKFSDTFNQLRKNIYNNLQK